MSNQSPRALRDPLSTKGGVLYNSLTIIGSGLAAYTLVREIRKLDKDFPITVVTADKGDYYSKPQLSNALSHQKSPEQLVLISSEKFAAQFNIEIIPHTIVESLDTISSAKIILATGASPIQICPHNIMNEGGAFSKQSVLSVNNLVDYTHFRKALTNQKSIIIIGAGLVGCEFANDLISTGYEVTVIAPENYPLARLVPEEMGISLKKALAEKGVKWRLGELFNPDEFSASSKSFLLSAVGLKPEITLAKAAGIKVNKGIEVDKFLQTSQPNVYALGDCMEFEGRLWPYIAPIAHAARALAKTLLGEPTPVVFPPMPIYIKTPLYPIVVLQPQLLNGQWQIEQNHSGIRALFYNENKLKGFALGGACAAESVDWIKKL